MRIINGHFDIRTRTIKHIFEYSLLMLFFILCPFLVSATNYTFSGTGHWTSASNWSPGYPGATIASGDNVVILSSSYLIIPPGFTVQNNGEITTYGEVFNSSGIISNDGVIRVYIGKIYNEGEINNNGSIYNEKFSVIENHGDIFIGDQGLLHNIHIDAEFFNYGNISIEGTLANNGKLYNYSNNFNNIGNFINERNVYNYSDITNYGYLQNSNNIFNYGRLFNVSAGVIHNLEAIYNYGSLVNSGDIDNYFAIVIECTGLYTGNPPNYNPLIYASADQDNDGYDAIACGGTDCDDLNNTVYPGAPEICDGLDNDCDGVVPPGEIDNDGDGYAECEGDCDDTNAAIHPGTIEICDGVDNNCDGIIYYEPELTISQSGLPAFCQGSVIVLTAHTNIAVNYAWSTGDTTPSIEIAADGIYSVTVTTAEGCLAEGSDTVSGFDATTLLSSYTILAQREIHMDRNTVFSGGVGVMDVHKKAKIHKGSFITAISAFVKAPVLELKGGSGVTTYFAAQVTVPLPAFISNPYNSHNDVTVAAGVTVTLTDTVYGKVEVKDGGTAIFTASRIFIKELKTKKNATLKFDCVDVFVKKKMELKENTILNPDTNKVTIYAEGGVKIEKGAQVIANIYSTKKIDVKKAKEHNPTLMMGMFIAEKVKSGDYVEWYWNTRCIAGTWPPIAPVASKTSNLEASTSNEFVGEPMRQKEVETRAYPNPFSDKVTIEFVLPEDDMVSLEVYSMSGQLIRNLFKGMAEKTTPHRYVFSATNLSGGFYIYKLQTSKICVTNKILLVR